MAELTPHLIEGLMSNIPPQQDFRRAVTIVSTDPGSVVYQIEVPESRFGALSDRCCQILRECVFVSATILTNDEISVTNAIESSACKQSDRENGLESEPSATFTRTREFFGSRQRKPSSKRKRGRARRSSLFQCPRPPIKVNAGLCTHLLLKDRRGRLFSPSRCGIAPKAASRTGDRPEAALLA